MNMTLLPGNSIVELETEQNALERFGLELPDSFRSRPIKIGRVVDSVMTGRDRAHIGVDSLIGSRVVVDGKNGSYLHGKSYRIRNLIEIKVPGRKTRYETPFLAIIPEGAVETCGDESKRCMWCGPAKSENSALSPLLVAGIGKVEYCPRCLKTASGEQYDPNAV